jgi:hypothetical protein
MEHRRGLSAVQSEEGSETPVGLGPIAAHRRLTREDRIRSDAPQKYVVIAGFVGEQTINEETGQKAVHNRGDVVTVGVEITEATAQVESHRNRIVVADDATVAAIRASEKAIQGEDAVFAGDA